MLGDGEHGIVGVEDGVGIVIVAKTEKYGVGFKEESCGRGFAVEKIGNFGCKFMLVNVGCDIKECACENGVGNGTGLRTTVLIAGEELAEMHHEHHSIVADCVNGIVDFFDCGS